MKKMLKIMAMLLVIGAVVFVAGCSDKNADTTAGNGSQEEMTNQAPIADNGTPNVTVTAEAPANITDNFTDNVTDNGTDNVTDNGTDNVTDNFTDNVTDNGTGNVTVGNDSA